MNYADIKNCDISNGEGIRVSLFVSGCTHHCNGCFNQEAWDFNYGKPFDETTKSYLLDLLRYDYIEGLSLLGGEPLEYSNQEALLPLLQEVKKLFPNKTIWCYSGYTYEQLINRKDLTTLKVLELIDVLVDGKFELEKASLTLKFRGSSNQRIIDLKRSLSQNELILYEV